MYRPPLLPVVAVRVLELSRSQDASFGAIVEVIESDPLFAASVLRSASSPLYASKTPLRSIHQALLRLGLQNLTDICVEVAMTGRVFKAQGYELPMEAIRRHSVAVAHAARLISQRVGIAAENAFSLGLLHEAGLAVGVIALNTPALWPTRFQPNRVWPVLSEVHVELLDRLVSAWTLPADLADGILNHHRAKAPIDGARAALDRRSCGHRSRHRLAARDQRLRGALAARGDRSLVPRPEAFGRRHDRERSPANARQGRLTLANTMR